MRRIVYGDNLPVLQELPAGSVPLIYIDPPFNTGRTQARPLLRTERADDGDRAGFRGARYRTTRLGSGPTPTRSTTTSASWSHACARRIACWPRTARSTSTSTTAKSTTARCCSTESSGATRSSTRSSGLTITARERRNAGQPSTTISSSTSKTRPITSSTPRGRSRAVHGTRPRRAGESGARQAAVVGLVAHDRQPDRAGRRPATRRRSRSASCDGSSPPRRCPGDLVLDFFAGSGTTGAAAAALGRDFLLVDDNEAALTTMARRFAAVLPDVEFVASTQCPG